MSENSNSGYEGYRLVYGAFTATMLLLLVEGIDVSDGLSRTERMAVAAFGAGFPFAVTGLFVVTALSLGASTGPLERLQNKPFWRHIFSAFLGMSITGAVLQLSYTFVHIAEGAPPRSESLVILIFVLAMLTAMGFGTGLVRALSTESDIEDDD